MAGTFAARDLSTAAPPFNTCLGSWSKLVRVDDEGADSSGSSSTSTGRSSGFRALGGGGGGGGFAVSFAGTSSSGGFTTSSAIGDSSVSPGLATTATRPPGAVSPSLGAVSPSLGAVSPSPGGLNGLTSSIGFGLAIFCRSLANCRSTSGVARDQTVSASAISRRWVSALVFSS